MKSPNIANLLQPQGRRWMKEVTQISKRLKKEHPDNPYLGKDIQTELFLKWKTDKDYASRDKLLASMYPLALKEVHEKINANGHNNIPIEDLEQEANMALLCCLDDYEPDKGTLPTFFRSYLPKFFYPALKTYGNFIRQPDNILKNMSIEHRAADQYSQIYHHPPQNGENFLYWGGEKSYEVIFGSTKIPTIRSGNSLIHSPDNEEDGCELFEILFEPEEENNDEKYDFLRTLVSTLSKREQEIVYQTYHTNLEAAEIVYQMRPKSPYDYERLYRRSENILRIKTIFGETQYKFYVYVHANKRQKNKITEHIIPISHPYSVVWQKYTETDLIFKLQKNDEITEVLLNGQEISHTKENDLYKISLNLRAGSIYSLANYNFKLSKIKDKLRKQIVKTKFLNIY